MAGYLADVKAIGGRTWTQVEWESRFFGYKRANTTTPSSWGTAAGRVGLWRGARLAGTCDARRWTLGRWDEWDGDGDGMESVTMVG